MKREGDLKSKFTAAMPDGYYLLRFASRAAPDRCIFGNQQTTLWECKHGTPGFDSPGDQELMCMRLARVVYCRYVLWLENPDGSNKTTLIVHPRVIAERKSKRDRHWMDDAEAFCVGHDMRWLVNYVRGIHEFCGQLNRVRA